MPSNWLVFDRLRSLAKRFDIYQAERNYQDQSDLDRLVSGGDFLDFNTHSTLLDQTNLHINRLERYKDYEQMDQTGEISLALDLYADETCLVDPERKHTLIIRARNRRLKKELEDLFYDTLLWDNCCRPAVRYLCKYGDLAFEIQPTTERDGVASIRFMDVYNFTRVETRYGDLVGFFFQDEIYPNPEFMHPWQVAHMRLTSFENIYHPYGRSIIDAGRKSFKQLRLMEDAALIYRITRSAEKRIFTIPVGNIPAKEIPEYMQLISRNFKRHRFYNPTTGTFDERYSPLIQEDDFFLPRRADGTGPEIDTLPGAENLDQIADIEYFKKKMIAPTKIPFSRVGIGEGAGESNEKSLSQSHSEFAKAVQWVQREVAAGLKKIAIVHLALKGYTVDDLKGFDVAMTSTSAMEELYRIETWQTRVGVMMDLKDLGWFPKEWIVTHFTDLSPDEIEELKDMESTDANGGPGGGHAGGLDLGGPEGEEDEFGPDMGPELGGPEEGGLEGPEPPGIEDEANDLALDGYDLAAERELLMEIASAKSDSKKRTLVEEWARRTKGAYTHPEISSGFTNMVENNEFDGLTGKNGTIFAVNVDAQDRDAVITETHRLLVSGDDDTITEDSGDEINEGDVPH